jgi:hypothetical protein
VLEVPHPLDTLIVELIEPVVSQGHRVPLVFEFQGVEAIIEGILYPYIDFVLLVVLADVVEVENKLVQLNGFGTLLE